MSRRWIPIARAELGRLRLRDPRRLKELDAFLAKAGRIAPRNGERTACRDGSRPAAGGDCSWDSLGGHVFSVERGRDATTITVTQYVSA